MSIHIHFWINCCINGIIIIILKRVGEAGLCGGDPLERFGQRIKRQMPPPNPHAHCIHILTLHPCGHLRTCLKKAHWRKVKQIHFHHFYSCVYSDLYLYYQVADETNDTGETTSNWDNGAPPLICISTHISISYL